MSKIDEVEVSANHKMLPTGWMIYDVDKNVIAAGIMGVGKIITPGKEDAVAHSMILGYEAYRQIINLCKAEKDLCGEKN